MCFTEFSQTLLVEVQVCQLSWCRNCTGSLERPMSRRWSCLHGIQSRVVPCVFGALKRAVLRTSSYVLFRRCRTSYVTIGSRLKAGRIVLNQVRVGERSQATAVELMVCRYQRVGWAIAEFERNLECSGTATALKRAVSEGGVETNTVFRPHSLSCVVPSAFLSLVQCGCATSSDELTFSLKSSCEMTSSRDHCATQWDRQKTACILV